LISGQNKVHFSGIIVESVLFIKFVKFGFKYQAYDYLVDYWMVLSKAYGLVAPALKNAAEQYARISYKYVFVKMRPSMRHIK
jgi:hypothetical protein